MKKTTYNVLSIAFLILLFLQSFAFADTLVQVTPKTKITTSNLNLKEGDNVDFVVMKDVFYKNELIIKKGSTVQGLVTFVEPNGFSGTEAKITIEQLAVRDLNNKRVKLIGNIYKKGNSHENFSIFMDIWLIRGGEVQIRPQADTFNLFVKENL